MLKRNAAPAAFLFYICCLLLLPDFSFFRLFLLPSLFFSAGIFFSFLFSILPAYPDPVFFIPSAWLCPDFSSKTERMFIFCLSGAILVETGRTG